MFKSALIATVAAALAVPGVGLAKGSSRTEASAALENAAGPIPYSQLAEADARINGAGAKMSKANKARKKTSGGASTSASTAPPASAQAAGGAAKPAP